MTRSPKRRATPALDLLVRLFRTGRFKTRAKLADAMMQQGRRVSRNRVAVLIRFAKERGLITEEELPSKPGMARRRRDG